MAKCDICETEYHYYSYCYSDRNYDHGVCSDACFYNCKDVTGLIKDLKRLNIPKEKLEDLIENVDLDILEMCSYDCSLQVEIMRNVYT